MESGCFNADIVLVFISPNGSHVIYLHENNPTFSHPWEERMSSFQIYILSFTTWRFSFIWWLNKFTLKFLHTHFKSWELECCIWQIHILLDLQLCRLTITNSKIITFISVHVKDVWQGWVNEFLDYKSSFWRSQLWVWIIV